MNSYLLPLFVAALALYASTLASRLLRRLRDLRLLDKLPHPPATSVVKGVEITGKDFHRTLTQFAAKYGGIYSIRFYLEKVGRSRLQDVFMCHICCIAVYCAEHERRSCSGLDCERTQMVIVSDPVLVHQVLSREGPLGFPLDKAVSGYFGVDMVRLSAV